MKAAEVIVRSLMDGLPPFTPMQEAMIRDPKTPDGKRLAKLAETFDAMPLDEGQREFLPLVKFPVYQYLLWMETPKEELRPYQEAVSRWLERAKQALD